MIGVANLGPVVPFPELTQRILHYLHQHQEAGSLTWYGTLRIAKKECWIKIGTLFKLSLANINQLNGVRNTAPHLVFGAKDTPENLATALKPYSEELLQLQQSAQDNLGW